MNKQNIYIILLKANIFQQRSIPHTVVFILFITNYSCGIFDHIIGNIKLIEQEVYIEQYADTEGNPSLD